MVQTAELEKLSTLEVATRNAQRFKEMDQASERFVRRFIRTNGRTTPSLQPGNLAADGRQWRYLSDRYAGWYSVRDEAYYAEDETLSARTRCGRGPQGTPVDWVERKSYFFKLSAYQDRLLALYNDQPDFIGPDFAPQRGHELRERRTEGPVDLAHDVRLGRQGTQ